MKVTANRPTYVESNGKRVLLEAGQEAEVDGRKYALELKHGDLEEVEDKPKRGRKPKQETVEPETEQETQSDTE